MLRSAHGYLGRMQVRDLPAGAALAQNDGTAIDKACPVVQMKCHNRDIAEHLNLHVFWLKVHVGRSRLAMANLLEDGAKPAFKLRPATGTLGEGAGIEHSRIVGEGVAKSVPIEIVEGAHECRN